MTVRKELNSQWVYFTLPLVIIFAFTFAVHLKLPFLVLFFIFGVMAKLDQLLSQDWVNPTLEEIKELENKQGFRVLLYLALLLDWTAIFMAPKYIQSLSWYNYPPLLVLLSLLNSMSFLVAHELFHKDSVLDKFFGTIHQIKNFYMHFTIEHLQGHHKRVSTPQDAASAPKGMTLYEFLPRSIIGSLRSAYEFNPLLVLAFSAASFIFFWVIYVRAGLLSFAILLIGGFGGVLVLETINYVEHYGLRRKRNPDGTYEKVTIRHSWNAPHRFTNCLLFKLQRHSDHHQNSMKPYQTLCSYEDSPQLPHGYVGCLIIAAFPKLWFDMMDPLVEQYATDSSKGAHLKNLKTAQQKAQNILGYTFKVSLGLALVELAVNVLLL